MKIQTLSLFIIKFTVPLSIPLSIYSYKVLVHIIFNSLFRYKQRVSMVLLNVSIHDWGFDVNYSKCINANFHDYAIFFKVVAIQQSSSLLAHINNYISAAESKQNTEAIKIV